MLILSEVVVEHAFLLLGALLGSVKAQLDSSRFRHQRGSKISDEEEVCVTPQMALMLWLWALQVTYSITDKTLKNWGFGWWVTRLCDSGNLFQMTDRRLTSVIDSLPRSLF